MVKFQASYFPISPRRGLRCPSIDKLAGKVDIEGDGDMDSVLYSHLHLAMLKSLPEMHVLRFKIINFSYIHS